ncbi:uncharacterized protein LOC143276695 [Babylonia areolata]|uniref:uncharacterized protein LOC143276695 n=1 Tax=Babylonia areolata TaxID=304850 RepID=UPI003FD50605
MDDPYCPAEWLPNFTESAFQLMADQSNLYAEELLSGITELSRHSWLNAAKDVTVPEMKAYTALQIMMGLCCKPEIEDRWWTYWLLNLPFGTIMCKKPMCPTLCFELYHIVEDYRKAAATKIHRKAAATKIHSLQHPALSMSLPHGLNKCSNVLRQGSPLLFQKRKQVMKVCSSGSLTATLLERNPAGFNKARANSLLANVDVNSLPEPHPEVTGSSGSVAQS